MYNFYYFFREECRSGDGEADEPWIMTVRGGALQASAERENKRRNNRNNDDDNGIYSQLRS